MFYKIALSSLKGVGVSTATQLLALTEGDAKALFHFNSSKLEKNGVNTRKLLSLKAKKEALEVAENEMEFIKKNGITPLFFKDNNYPSRLKECKGAPILLYTKGNANLNTLRVISIVGTRQPTQQGIETTKALVKEISNIFPNALIVSGLAYGIDVTAHKAALRHKLPTAAVLGHGLQMLYPAAHRSIAQRIIEENGMLISQYTSAATVLPKNFIERNTVVAAMADATLVVESKARGGAMATAHIANSYGRDVLAVPGSILEEKSKGCNKLIKTNIAALVENAKDIGYALGWESNDGVSQPQLLFDLTKEEQELTTILQQKGKMSLDVLCAALSTTPRDLLPIITQLEFKDLLLAHPGKFYSLKK